MIEWIAIEYIFSCVSAVSIVGIAGVGVVTVIKEWRDA